MSSPFNEGSNPPHPAESRGRPSPRGLLIGLCGLLVVAGLFVGPVYRFFFPYLDQEVSGPIIITTDWTEIKPKKSLRVVRQIQMLVLDLDRTLSVERDGWGIVLPDGSTVTPEVQLIDEDGKIYVLNHPGSWWNPSTGETHREFFAPDLPKSKIYPTVRIRSAKPIHCNKIFWRNYNQWDVS
jgi:hypothetical protein